MTWLHNMVNHIQIYPSSHKQKTPRMWSGVFTFI